MFILFFLVFILLSNNVYSDVILRLPVDMEVQELNKGVKKIQNRYTDFDQVENQYKGKLIYKPSDSMYKNDRLYRFFTSAFFMINDNSFKLGVDRDTKVETLFDKNNNVSNSLAAEVGVYVLPSAFTTFEYFEYNGDTLNFNYYDKNKNYSNFKMNHKGKAFMLNFGLENHYSKIIPFFGVGVGVFKNDFEEIRSSIFTTSRSELEVSLMPVYQVFAGIDIEIVDSMFITLKYKYFDFLSDIRLKRNYYYDQYSYDLKFNKNFSSYLIGIKYLW